MKINFDFKTDVKHTNPPKCPLKIEKMEYNKEEVERLIKRLKEEPKLSLYDYALTDLIRYLLMQVEILKEQINILKNKT